jgi:hypothetical protein
MPLSGRLSPRALLMREEIWNSRILESYLGSDSSPVPLANLGKPAVRLGVFPQLACRGLPLEASPRQASEAQGRGQKAQGRGSRQASAQRQPAAGE